MPLSATDILLRALYVLLDHRDVPTRCLASLPLYPASLSEQLHSQHRRTQCLGPLPRHSAIRELLTGRARHDDVSVPELLAVNRPHILKNQLRGVAFVTVDM